MFNSSGLVVSLRGNLKYTLRAINLLKKLSLWIEEIFEIALLENIVKNRQIVLF